MEKNNGRKWTIAAFLLVCVALTGLTVAFATLTEQLDIDPKATVKGNTWKVGFDPDSIILNTTGDGTIATPVGSLVKTSNKIEGINVTLTLPGDSAIYTFDVVNEGTIDAKIESIDIGEPVCKGDVTLGPTEKEADELLVCSKLTYTLEYTDGGIPATNDPLPASGANSTRNMTLTIAYTGSAVPSKDVTIEELDISINYVQD